MEGFFNLYRHGFIRVAVGIPRVRVADPAFNARETLALMEKAAEEDAVVALFPELGLSAYSCEDLFHQKALLEASKEALRTVIEASKELPLIALVGLPLQVDHLLYNCAAVISQGSILGVVPKSFLPNYREFYELRQFTPAFAATANAIELFGQAVPFGNRLLFRHASQPLFSFFAEICEDLWVPIPPSSYAAMAGATLLLNLSASNITVGKAAYRRELVGHQSARCLSAYAYCAAGMGESTTDLAWDGHALIYENGRKIAESERFAYEAQLVLGDIDLEHLDVERMRQNSFSQAVRFHKEEIGAFRDIPFSLPLPEKEKLLLSFPPERFPYVPADPSQRDRRCQEVYAIQVQGLAKRLQSTGIERVVIGVSGGLDSTQALIVCARTMDILGLPRKHILAYTMPGFATSERTLKQARALMEAVGASRGEIDIRPSCLQMLKDIGHPYAEGKPVFDTTFENVQAGERTSHLFRIANLQKGLVVGTSDLSELALGWCTYGVGDHMAHYHVNASVPKTLIQYLIRWVADTRQIDAQASSVLYDVLDTVISPELVPGEGEQPPQASESVVGPYELQDFHLYYTLRFGYPPPKVAFLAYCAWRDRHLGNWPTIPEHLRREYGIADIKRWLQVFLERFFKFSQFKRSCVPNAPKVGSGGSLSPRGDYRAPSDSEADAWLAQLEAIPDTDP